MHSFEEYLRQAFEEGREVRIMPRVTPGGLVYFDLITESEDGWIPDFVCVGDELYPCGCSTPERYATARLRQDRLRDARVRHDPLHAAYVEGFLAGTGYDCEDYELAREDAERCWLVSEASDATLRRERR